MLSFPDIAVLGGLALIVFGPEQMPKIARQVGQFMGTMRSTSNAFMREMDVASLMHPEPAQTPTVPPEAPMVMAQPPVTTPEQGAHAVVAPAPDIKPGGLNEPHG